MAELVDALVSGTSIRKDVQVRVLFRAPAKMIKPRRLITYGVLFLISCILGSVFPGSRGKSGGLHLKLKSTW